MVNECFEPTEAEKSWAKKIVEAAEAAGGAAVSVDGKMVDRPVIARAEAILAHSQASARSLVFAPKCGAADCDVSDLRVLARLALTLDDARHAEIRRTGIGRASEHVADDIARRGPILAQGRSLNGGFT